MKSKNIERKNNIIYKIYNKIFKHKSSSSDPPYSSSI